MIVAVNEYLPLRLCIAGQCKENSLQIGLLSIRQGGLPMLDHIPVDEQLHFGQQPVFIVSG